MGNSFLVRAVSKKAAFLVGAMSSVLTGTAAVAQVSDATLLRMAAMKAVPAIDGAISIDEQKYSSVQYGPISGTTKLMSVRYGSFFVGYTDDGIEADITLDRKYLRLLEGAAQIIRS